MPLDEFLQKRLADFPSLTENPLERLANLPLTGVPTYDRSWSLSLEDGNTLELVIQIPLERIEAAIRRFGELRGRKCFSCEIFGTLQLTGSTLTVPESTGSADDWIRSTIEDTGIFAGLPSAPMEGVRKVPRVTFVLRVRTAYDQMPDVIEHFKPFLRSTFENESFVVSTAMTAAAHTFTIQSPEGLAIDWWLGGPWLMPLLDRPFNAYAEERRSALEQLRLAWNDSRPQIAAFQDPADEGLCRKPLKV